MCRIACQYILLGIAFACLILIPAQAQERYIYWTGLTDEPQAIIFRGSLDDARIDTILSSAGTAPAGIAVDFVHQKLYWTGIAVDGEPGEMTISRSNLNGSDAEVLIGGIICGTGGLTDIEVDLLHNVLYWGYDGDCTAVELMRANLDGSDFDSDVIKGQGIIEYPTYIALDPLNQKIYWADQLSSSSRGPSIRRATYDGTDLETVIDSPSSGIALDLKAGKLYWATANSIRRANLSDGSNAEDVITAINPADVALDVQNSKIYWTEREAGTIRRANLDGSEVEDLFTGLQAPHRLALSFENYIAVSNETSGDIPEDYILWPNYPNPFNPSTTIRFDLPAASHVSLVVYDLLGREVAQLVDETLAAGMHRATWEASEVPSGSYIYELRVGTFQQSRLMLLLK